MTTPACCPEGSLPPVTFDTGQSIGTTQEIEKSYDQDSMKIYVTPPNSLRQSKRIVVVFSDVYGYSSGLHFQFADALAKKLGTDTTVVIPDLFRGSPCMQPWSIFGETVGGALGFPAMLFRAKFWYHSNYVYDSTTKLILPWLKNQSSSTCNDIEFSCVGFCFGGWVIGKTIGLGVPWKCGVGMHPAFNLEKVHGGTEHSLAEGVGAVPYFLMPAGNDSKEVKVGGAATNIMAEARAVEESDVSLTFPKMLHGWVTRGNPKDVNIKNAQTRALNKTVEFINTYHKV